MEAAVFIISAAIILGGAFGVVLSKNPVHAALSLVASLFGVAVLFVELDAQLLAAVQVIVYTGAIVVLILFVLMLLGVDKVEDLSVEPVKVQRPLAVALGVLALAAVVAVLVVPWATTDTPEATQTIDPNTGQIISEGRDADDGFDEKVVTGERAATAPIDPDTPNVNQLGESLFTTYVFAFEATALLLTIAVIGAVALARRQRDYVPLPGPEAPDAPDASAPDEEEFTP